MKKITLFATAFFAVLCVNAGHTIVVKSDKPQESGKSEVSVNNDTIAVTPSIVTSYIEVSVKNDVGNTVSQEIVPANVQSSLTVPTLPTGYLLEIRDDNGLIYQEAN